MNRIRKLFANPHDGLHTPLVTLFVWVAVVTGTVFTFFQGLPDVQNSLLYKYGVFLDLTIWGPLMMFAGLTLVIGLFAKRDSIMKLGSFMAFVLWAFAFMTYLTNGFYYAMLSYALVQMCAHGVIYLRAARVLPPPS